MLAFYVYVNFSEMIQRKSWLLLIWSMWKFLELPEIESDGDENTVLSDVSGEFLTEAAG